jgi:hypothetical protein
VEEIFATGLLPVFNASPKRIHALVFLASFVEAFLKKILSSLEY